MAGKAKVSRLNIQTPFGIMRVGGAILNQGTDDVIGITIEDAAGNVLFEHANITPSKKILPFIGTVRIPHGEITLIIKLWHGDKIVDETKQMSVTSESPKVISLKKIVPKVELRKKPEVVIEV